MNDRKAGLIAAFSCYILWGVLPAYWKFLDHVNAYEILAHRILWSFVFMIPVLYFFHQKEIFKDTVKDLWHHKKKGLLMTAASILIAADWGIFIWAVTNGHVLDASFGYYINPLLNVFLGVILFQERLSRMKWFSIAIAACGILGMSIEIGHFPWIALSLAATFGFYGACKKDLHISPFVSITLETIMVLPFALAYIFSLHGEGMSHFTAEDPATSLLLIGAGIVTALPLLLFSAGANYLPLNVLGFCQYISPTITLLIGIFLFREPFDETKLLGFSVIWFSLVIFTLSDIREQRHLKKMREMRKDIN